jgi:hypothetical protein
MSLHVKTNFVAVEGSPGTLPFSDLMNHNLGRAKREIGRVLPVVFILNLKGSQVGKE